MKYKALIGLEMHCEISETNTKVFSPSENSYKETPNENINEIDLGFPGVLPTVNKKAVEKALMASIILNCNTPEYIYFERKNYYYPDLPKGYQITQETKPCPVGIYGTIEYELNDEIKEAKINNIHLEEDSASLEHYENYSLINYNRAGVPLLELVTEPCFHNAEEAVSFLETIRNIYRYTNISEADSKKGQIRCDVNVSLMDENLDETEVNNWGVKVEIKNVNSFSSVEAAINYEINRQTELLTKGDTIIQETRRWDEETLSTIHMRNKIDAIDYKYFIEPNIPKYKVTEKWLNEIKSKIVKLPSERKSDYIINYSLTKKDATILTKDKDISDYFEELIRLGSDAKEASNWITTRILGYLNKNFITIDEFFITPKMLNELIKLISTGKISSQQGKDVFNLALEKNKTPQEIVKEENMSQISNEEEILEVINKVLSENTEQVNMYKSGKTNLLGYLVGQVLKSSGGKFNPGLTADILKRELDKM